MGTELSNAVALEDIILSHPVELACRIFTNAFNLVIILVSQCAEVVRAIITDVPQVFDLTLVTGLNPFHLLGTVVLDSVDLLRVVVA